MSSHGPFGLLPLDPGGTARGVFLGPADNDPTDALPSPMRERLLEHGVSDETIAVAWEVTRWSAAAPLPDRRALAMLVIALLAAMEDGGTCLPLGSTTGTSISPGLSGFLSRLGFAEAERHGLLTWLGRLLAGTASPETAALFGPPEARRPLVLADGGLYPERLWWAEHQLVAMLRARLAAAPPAFGAPIESALAAISNVPGAMPLDAEQSAALHAALLNPLTVIAGGPGTGKTSIIVALLRALVRLGVAPSEIALAAPTGRAAERINESVASALAALEMPPAPDAELSARFHAARTLHRLLGVRPPGWRVLELDGPEFHAGWRLPHRVVVVDEASMIDLPLMQQLLAAVKDQARLILLGDVNQLPSVGVGAVFRDLANGLPAATRRLEKSHRMDPQAPAGAQILGVAGAVRSGTFRLAPETACPRAADVRFTGFEHLAAAWLPELLDRWAREIVDAGGASRAAVGIRVALDQGRLSIDPAGPDAAEVRKLRARHAAARILCVTKSAGHTTSADAINRALHVRFQEAAREREPLRPLGAGLLPGEPVIVLRNDRARDLYNGDLGVVLRAPDAQTDRLCVAFERPNGIVVFPIDDLGERIALAFALTVHKAQGSESTQVAFILPATDVPLLSREILYTALTRARESVVVVGDPALFTRAAERPMDRTSGISVKLADADADG